MTTRRAAAIGAAAGILPGLYLGLRAVQAELLVRQADRTARTIIRLLRDDRRRRALESTAAAGYRELLAGARSPAT